MKRYCLAAILALAPPAAATVSEGAAKWRAGDWAGAVNEWVAPAARGDPDALFNMGQAYKLGRGVAANLSTAQDYYRRAAAKGHLAATANLGITLYQSGQKTEALGFLRQAADRGDARAAYVLGVATFNGDGAPRNTTLGYAYMLRAREGELPQADAQAARMAVLLSPVERSRGEAAAAALAAGEPVPVELLGPRPAVMAAAPPPAADAADGASAPARPAEPVRTAEARPAPPPAPRPAAPPRPVPEKAVPEKAAAEKATPETAVVAKAATEQAADTGVRVQLGAYATEAAAKSAWTTLVAAQADVLVGKKPVYSPRGNLVRLQIAFTERAAARELCAKIAAAGRPCFVTVG